MHRRSRSRSNERYYKNERSILNRGGNGGGGDNRFKGNESEGLSNNCIAEFYKIYESCSDDEISDGEDIPFELNDIKCTDISIVNSGNDKYKNRSRRYKNYTTFKLHKPGTYEIMFYLNIKKTPYTLDEVDPPILFYKIGGRVAIYIDGSRLKKSIVTNNIHLEPFVIKDADKDNQSIQLVGTTIIKIEECSIITLKNISGRSIKLGKVLDIDDKIKSTSTKMTIKKLNNITTGNE
jgi:hypothetical protein